MEKPSAHEIPLVIVVPAVLYRIYMSKIRILHVAVGGRGNWPVRIMGADDRFESVGLVDLSDTALAASAEALGLPGSACFKDVGEALEAVDCDAVVICSPTTTHARFCRLAFAHNKHVLVEKGMTHDWEEARALVREAEAAGVKFCVSQNYRYQAPIRAVQAILSDSSHPCNPGDPRIIDFMQHRYRPDPRTLTFPFSMVWDMSVHHIDLLAYLKGPLQRVEARTFTAPWSRYNHEANVNAFLEFADGSVCNYLLTHDGRYSENCFMLQGERGVLRLGQIAGEPQTLTFRGLPERALRSGEAVECPIAEVQPDVQFVVNDFYAYITDGTEPGISGRNNLKTLAGCEMICRSASERRPVTKDELGDY